MARAQTADRKKCVKLAKEIAKTRDGYQCQKCPRNKAQGWQMHGAHIIPETYSATCANPDNILTLCAACHSMGGNSAHQNPIQFGRWFDEHYPGLYDRMEAIALPYSRSPFPKIDWAAVYKELKEQHAALSQ